MQFPPVLKRFTSKLSPELRLTWLIRFFSLYSIPLLAFVWPRVKTLTQAQSVLLLPLDWRTKNHLGSMYFGALNMGAEAVVALHLLDEMEKSGDKVSFAFKDFHADFLERASGGNVLFICEEGEAVRALYHEAKNAKKRITKTFSSFAQIEGQENSQEKVASFQVSLSVKVLE